MDKTIRLKTSLAHILRLEFNQLLASRHAEQLPVSHFDFQYKEKEIHKDIQQLCEVFVPLNNSIFGTDANGSDIVHHAAELNLHRLIYLLAALGFNIDYINKFGMTPISTAAYTGSYEACQTLIELGINVNFIAPGSYGPLIGALLNGQYEIVELLKRHGAQLEALDTSGENYAVYAARFGQLFELERLLEAGLDINTANLNGENLFWIATQENQIHAMKFLRQRGACIDHKSIRDGRNPLHIAALHGYQEALELLIQYGADLNTPDENGDTALSLAIKFNQYTILKLLLECNVDLEVHTPDEMTPLHIAASVGNDHCIELLLHIGIHIDIKNAHGNTPFHIATLHNRISSMMLLQEHGANINMCNDDGLDAVDIAVTHNSLETIKILKRLGVDKAQNFYELYSPFQVMTDMNYHANGQIVIDLFDSLQHQLPFRATQHITSLHEEEIKILSSNIVQYPAFQETTLFDFALEKAMETEYNSSTRRTYCQFLSQIYNINSQFQTLQYSSTTAALRVALDFFQIEELEFIASSRAS